MTTILILEGNPPDLIRQGKADALPFVASLMAIDPGLRLHLANPYARAIGHSMLDGVDGVVFTGSGTSWATDAPEAAPQRDAMEMVFGTGRPSWGSCNGMQLATVILGGSVRASPNGVERGIALEITLSEEGADHPMMAGKSRRFASPCSHRDEVGQLPAKAVLIAGNAHSPVQAMVYEQDGVDFWGVQYHPECAASDVADWVRSRTPELADMAADLDAVENDAEAAGRLGTSPSEMAFAQRTRELANWLDHVNANA